MFIDILIWGRKTVDWKVPSQITPNRISSEYMNSNITSKLKTLEKILQYFCFLPRWNTEDEYTLQSEMTKTPDMVH